MSQIPQDSWKRFPGNTIFGTPRRKKLPKLRIQVQKCISMFAAPLVEQQYEFFEMLGQGTISVVRRARKYGSSSPSVIKTVRTSDEEIAMVVRREYKILCDLQGHPNIVQCEEMIEDPMACRVDIVMAFVPGVSLDKLVRSHGKLKEYQARPLFVQLLRAIHHCHVHRVCHRDIKPSNIIVSADEECTRLILIDFNAAAQVGSSALGNAVTPTGTRPYMSPEAMCTSRLYNEMTDVWSSGVCLYFMLMGHVPWVGQRWHILLMEVTRFPIQFPIGLSSDALKLLRGLLCRSVANRLMVAGALALPWCELSEVEIHHIYGIRDPEMFLPQPSYRNWEVKARTVLLHAEQGAAKSDVCMPKVLSTSRSWPFLRRPFVGSAWFDKHCHGHCMLDSGICWDSRMAFRKAPKPCSRKLALQGKSISSGAPSGYITTQFRNWEVKLRRAHLEDLYGPTMPQPSYRNWEVSSKFLRT